jgi:hypothetical protein
MTGLSDVRLTNAKLHDGCKHEEAKRTTDG